MTKKKGSGSGRADKNGLTGTRYWIWLRSKFPVLEFLEAIGVRMYPKYDPGPKTGQRSIEKNEWSLDKIGMISVVWLDRKGPRVGGRKAQFNTIQYAVAVTLKDMALTPEDFVLPPLPPATIYPRRPELDAILEAARPPASAQPRALNPMPIMLERTYESTALAMMEDPAWDRIHADHRTRGMSKKTACADDLADMEEAVRLGLRPLRHERLQRPISELVAELGGRERTDKAEKAPALAVVRAPPAKGEVAPDDPLTSVAKHTRTELVRARERREQAQRALEHVCTQIERLTARKEQLEADMPGLEEAEKRISASLCALTPDAALADVTRTLDEAERSGTAPAMRQE